MKRLHIAIAAIVVIGFCVMGISSAHSFTKQNKQLKRENLHLKTEAHKKRQLEVKHKQLEQKLDTEVKAKDVNQQKVRELQKQKSDLEKALQAKKAAKAKLASKTQKPSTGAQNGSGGIPSILLRIRACESGNYYQAQNKVSTASGAYQFLDSTWAGYKGYAKARYAPPHIQDERAIIEYQRNGTKPWNPSRHCWG